VPLLRFLAIRTSRFGAFQSLFSGFLIS